MLVRVNSGGGDWLSFDTSAGDVLRSLPKSSIHAPELCAAIRLVLGFCPAGSTGNVGLMFRNRAVGLAHVS